MDRAAVYAEITKSEKQDDGTLLVQGRVSDETLDVDKQIADAAWLKRAIPEWFSTGGNLREMHTPNAVGVATEYEEKSDGGHHIVAKVVDPLAVKKVEHGVLRGFSIGIKGPRIVTDTKAAGGRIVDGKVVEVSLVDRPANPSCTLVMAKAAVPGMEVRGSDLDTERMLVRVEELHETDTAPGAVAHSGTTSTNGPSSQIKTAEPDPAAEATPATPAEPGEAAAGDTNGAGGDVSDVPAVPAAVAAPETSEAVVDGTGKAAATAPDPTPDGLADLVAKAVAAALPGALAAELEKRDFSAGDRKRLAKEGKAMPGGGFPIATVGDLRNAIQAIGRAKNPAAARAHIKERARALGREDLIPDEWKGADPDLTKVGAAEEMAHDPALLQQVRDGLLNLLIAEAQEALQGEREEYDLQQLVGTLARFLDWWDHETWEGEAPAPSDVKGTQPDVTKTADADTAPHPPPASAPPPAPAPTPDQTPADEAGKGTTADTVKAQIAEATAALLSENEQLKARLERVEKAAAPGGPVRVQTLQQRQVSAETDALRAEVVKFEALERAYDDPALAAEARKRATAARQKLAAAQATA